MAVSFEDIGPKFDRVFGFIERDLKRILTLSPGGNFAVAGLAACACETLARYRYGSGEGAEVFTRLMPSGPLRIVAKDVYDTLRNGLVHRYDAADILVEGKTIQLGISWRDEPHLSVKRSDGVPNLILNVTTLCADLFAQFADYHVDLRQSAEARDHFYTEYRSTGVKKIEGPAQVAAWKEIVPDAFE
jgi:hypothetical protein